MSKRRGWWYHTRDVVQSYPARRESLRAGPLPPVARREQDAVEEAVRRTGELPDGPERLRVIELVHWRGSHAMTGAAGAAHVSLRTAERWQREFFLQVAKICGFLDEASEEKRHHAHSP